VGSVLCIRERGEVVLERGGQVRRELAAVGAGRRAPSLLDLAGEAPVAERRHRSRAVEVGRRRVLLDLGVHGVNANRTG
jgi:hypothetical protein